MVLAPFLVAILVALILLFLGSALLRAGVGIANKTIGPVERNEPIGWDWDAEEDDEDLFPSDAPAIPEPSIGHGMRIVFLAAVGYLFLGIVLEFLLREEFRIRRGLDSVEGLLLMLVFGFLILSSFTAWLLPTTFKRGALVTFFSYLIVLGVVLVVGVLVFIITRIV